MEKFEVNILGCGSATPTPYRNPSCQVLNIRDHLYMVDCGEGAQAMMRKMGLKFSRLRHIFITHMHGDHCLGLPGLLSTMALHEVGGHVSVYLPRDGVEIMEANTRFFCDNSGIDIEMVPIDGPGRIFENSHLTVEAIQLYHRMPTFGYIFREKPGARHLRGDMAKYLQIPVSAIPSIKQGADWTAPDGTVYANDRLTTDPDPARSYAYCSDTLYNPAVAKAVGKVNLLYHEATYASDMEKTARERGHSTAAQAATTAKAAGADRLLIGHYSKRYRNPEILRAEAAAIFPNVKAAAEGLTIKL